jgi:hypothetical protein
MFMACNGPSSKNEDGTVSGSTRYAFTPPAAGTTVAADSIKVAEDHLNNSWFAVRLTVSDNNTGKRKAGFRYDVHASYGAAATDGLIVMPYGGEHLKPILRRGAGYSYIVGFVPGKEYGGDTAFHEYYRISAAKEHHIDIEPLNGFIIDAE